MNYKEKIIELVNKIENQQKEELLYKIISITEVLTVCEYRRILDYLLELYFS